MSFIVLDYLRQRKNRLVFLNDAFCHLEKVSSSRMGIEGVGGVGAGALRENKTA